MTSPESIRGAAPRGERPEPLRRARPLWMHTFSPAKMWIAGLARPPEAAPPPAHAVRPRPAVGGDRHGLHEPEPVGARRPRVRLPRDANAARDAKTVVGHWREPQRPRADRRRGRARPRDGTRRSRLRSPASATTCARSRSPRATRSRRRSASASRVDGYGVGELVAAVRDVDDASVDGLVSEYEDAYELAPGAAGAAASDGSRCATRRESRRACAGSSNARRLQGLHGHLRGPRRTFASSPVSPSSG